MGPNSRKNTQLAQAKAPVIAEGKEKQQQLTPENGQDLSSDHSAIVAQRVCSGMLHKLLSCTVLSMCSCCMHVTCIVSFVPGLGLISPKVWFDSDWADIRIQVQLNDRDEIPTIEPCRPLVVTTKIVHLPSQHWLAI